MIGYDYEKRFKEREDDWQKVSKKNMMKALGNAYIKPELVVTAMHDGLTVVTPFAHYRAKKKIILTPQ